MPRTHPPYSPEFRRQMVDLVRAGRDPDDLAREFEPTGQSIRTWVAQADRNEGRRAELTPGLAAVERDELIRLRRENKQLRLERDILSKAAAWTVRSKFQCTRTKPTLGRRHYLRAASGRFSLSCRRARRLEPQDRRLVDGEPPAHRAGAGRDGDGGWPTSAEGRHPPQRPRQPIYVRGIRQAVWRGRGSPIDGVGR